MAVTRKNTIINLFCLLENFLKFFIVLIFKVYDANGRRFQKVSKLLVYTASICYQWKKGLKKQVRNANFSDEWTGGIAVSSGQIFERFVVKQGLGY